MVSIRNRLEFKQCKDVLKHETIIFTQSLNNKPVITSLAPTIRGLGFAAHFAKRAVLRKVLATTSFSPITPSLHGQICALFGNPKDVSCTRHLIRALSGSQFNHLILGGICFQKTWSLAGIQTMLQMHAESVKNAIPNTICSPQHRLINALSSPSLRTLFLINSLHSKDENK